MGGRILATFDTTQGRFVAELFADRAPRTVENFVGLAEGTREFLDPRTRTPVRRPFYDGLVFHRVIEGFMIQGGCPRGTGTGGPGYQFADEFHRTLRHDRPGRLSMANAGPGTNGSQFFVTVDRTPHLDDRHSIFGQVVEGMDVVYAISRVATDANDRPAQPVVIRSVTIGRTEG
jgi:peptidyl-prolyl cis-trans isomerase A (cyclophilin A)